MQNVNTQHTTKQLYNIIMTEKYDKYEVFVETTWNSTFKRQIPWGKLWIQNFASYATGKTHDVLFKLIHNCLPTKVRLQKNHHKRGNYTIKCKYCKKTEDTLHVFARCQIAGKIWKTYDKMYEKLLPNIRFIYEEAAISLNLVDTTITPNTRKLTLILTNIILHELWTPRNKFEKDNILPNIDRSVTTINPMLKDILEV